MKRAPSFRYLLSVAVLALLALTLVGHVCALPLHDHPATDDQHDGADSVHGASCEVARSTSSVTVCPIVDAASLVDRRVDDCARAFQTFSRPLSVHSPPLFLLHAALLI
jgi:hypothetical protein